MIFPANGYTMQEPFYGRIAVRDAGAHWPERMNRSACAAYLNCREQAFSINPVTRLKYFFGGGRVSMLPEACFSSHADP